MEKNNTETGELLQEVNKAISTILMGGQSYKIGTRQLTRADLSTLRELKTDLERQNAADGSSLFDNTFVAVFDRR